MENKSNLPPLQSVSTPIITPGLDILKESWEIFKKIWKKLLGLMVVIPLLSSLIGAAILAVIFLIFLLASFAIGGPAVAAATTVSDTLEMISSTVGVLSLSGAVGNILSIILGIIGVITLIVFVFIPIVVGYYSVIFVLRDPELTAWSAFKKGLKFFWRYLWIIILMTVITLIGYLLFIIPGIIFSIWFTFAMYVLLIENIGGTKALGRSRQLVKGFWWTVFARLLLVAIFSMIISFILNLLTSLGGTLETLGEQSGQAAMIITGIVLSFVTFIISLAVNFIVYAVITIYKYLLYDKLKAVKEKKTEAVDGLSAGKKFGLSLVIIIPLIILIMLASLIAMVGIGSFIKNLAVEPSGIHLQPGQLSNPGSMISAPAVRTDNILPATNTQK